jgi:hypothetical protein
VCAIRWNAAVVARDYDQGVREQATRRQRFDELADDHIHLMHHVRVGRHF